MEKVLKSGNSHKYGKCQIMEKVDLSKYGKCQNMEITICWKMSNYGKNM